MLWAGTWPGRLWLDQRIYFTSAIAFTLLAFWWLLLLTVITETNISTIKRFKLIPRFSFSKKFIFIIIVVLMMVSERTGLAEVTKQCALPGFCPTLQCCPSCWLH